MAQEYVYVPIEDVTETGSIDEARQYKSPEEYQESGNGGGSSSSDRRREAERLRQLREAEALQRSIDAQAAKQEAELARQEQIQAQRIEGQVEQAPERIYDKPIPAYYNPKTGEKVYQSIDPTIAEEQGLKEFKVLGERGDKYIVEEESGFLTERQQKTKEILESPTGSKLGVFYGVSPGTQIQSVATPTTFLVDKPGVVKPTGAVAPTIPGVLVQPTETTTYEVAAKQDPYFVAPEKQPTKKEKAISFLADQLKISTEFGLIPKQVISPENWKEDLPVIGKAYEFRREGPQAYFQGEVLKAGSIAATGGGAITLGAAPLSTIGTGVFNVAAVKYGWYEEFGKTMGQTKAAILTTPSISNLAPSLFPPLPGEKTARAAKYTLASTGEIVGGVFLPRTYPEAFLDVVLETSLLRLGKKGVGRYLSQGALTGVGGYSAYSAATDPSLSLKERKELYFASGLALVGAAPGYLGGVRAFSARFGDTAFTTRTGDLGIKTGQFDVDGKSITAEFIPGRSAQYDAKKGLLISEEIQWKDTFGLPDVTAEQTKILETTQDVGGIVSGSLAQEALVKGARPFQDIDVLIDEPKVFGDLLESKFPGEFRITPKEITDSPLGDFEILKIYSQDSGKHLADIDPIKFAEEGTAFSFRDQTISFGDTGLQFLSPEVRLFSKAQQAGRPLPTGKRSKVAGDVGSLIGLTPEQETSLLRGYGLTKTKQKEIFLQSDAVLTHAGLGIVPRWSKFIPLEPKGEGIFFGTPSRASSDIINVRLSRAGFGETSYVSPWSLLNPSNWADLSFFPKRKGAVFEYGKLGGEFMQPAKGTSEIEIGEIIPIGGKRKRIVKRAKTVIEGERFDIALIETTTEAPSKNVFSRIAKSFETPIKTETKATEIFSKVGDSRQDLSLSKQIVLPARTRTGSIFSSITAVSRQPTRVSRVPEIFRDTRQTRFPREERTVRVPREERITRLPRTQREIRVPREERPLRAERFPFTPRKSTGPLKLPSFKAKPVKRQPQKAFNVQALDKGKWITLNAKPLSRAGAKDLGSRAVDNTTSKRFRIRPSKKAKGITNGDLYFSTYGNKFRPYRVKKKRKVPLQETFIEKTSFGIDTKGEKEGLSLAKWKAQRKKTLATNNPFFSTTIKMKGGNKR